MKNQCPYMENGGGQKRCVHKNGRGDCIYKNPEKCPLWKDSPQSIRTFLREANRRIQRLCGKRTDNE